MHKGGNDSEDIIMTRIHGEDPIAILGEGMRGKPRGGNDNEGIMVTRIHSTIAILGKGMRGKASYGNDTPGRK